MHHHYKDSISYHAAKSGSIQLMAWLLEHNVPVNAWTVQCAAAVGQLEMCKFLRSRGCAWDAQLRALTSHYD